MKRKIVITDIVNFICGILLFGIAFVSLIIFCLTADIDKVSIFFLALSLGLKDIGESTTKINFKEENNNGKQGG